MNRWIVLLLVVLFTSACVQEQLETGQNQISILDLSNVHLEPNAPTITNTAIATIEPTATKSPTATATVEEIISSDIQVSMSPSDTATPACSNQAKLVRHLSVSDNTEFKPGTYFAKVWLIENTGSCTWTTGYKLVYLDGNLTGGATETYLSNEVKPGESIELRLSFMAPIDPDLYISEWYIQDTAGNQFGLGAGDEPLHVQIVVRPLRTPIEL